MDTAGAPLIALAPGDELHTLLTAVQARYLALGQLFLQRAERLATLAASADAEPERLTEELRDALSVLDPWRRT